MVTDDLYWIGADKHRLALFENIHPLYHGVSYNAYVLLDEKTVLFDTTNGVLFSADAFGSFRSLDGKLFADEFDFDWEWIDDARR